MIVLYVALPFFESLFHWFSPYFQNALNSICLQSFRDVEILIVDNSQDLLGYGESGGRIGHTLFRKDQGYMSLIKAFSYQLVNEVPISWSDDQLHNASLQIVLKNQYEGDLLYGNVLFKAANTTL
jgi:hypothetical protein